MAGEVWIDLGRIDDIKIAVAMKEVKDEAPRQVTKITFETSTSVAEVARLLHLQRNHVALFAEIKAQQAEMDLQINQVDTKTGELVASGAAK